MNVYKYYRNKDDEPIGDDFDIDRHGDLCIMGDEKIKVIAKRARLELASKDGLMISGFVSTGFDKQGREKFIYCEWWVSYNQEETRKL